MPLFKLIVKHIAYATNRSYWVSFSLTFKGVPYTFNIPIYCSIFNIHICRSKHYLIIPFL